LRLEIAQQPGEGFLILVVVFPVGEVANVTRLANLGWPAAGNFFNRFIKLYWGSP
jgi:hypothetical protein